MECGDHQNTLELIILLLRKLFISVHIKLRSIGTVKLVQYYSSVRITRTV